MSQVSIIDIEGNNPQIPTEFVANIGSAIPLANVLEILGDSVAAGSNPVQTTASGNTLVVDVQTSQSVAASDATKIGLAAFNSAQFTVDANGFVGLIGGSAGIDSVATNVGGPVFPDGAGQISILGTIGIASSAPLRSNGTVANTVSLITQVSSAQAGSSINNAGMASFNSSMFTVDGNGYVSLIGGSVAVDSVAVQTGTSPVVPTAAGLLTINGAVVAAGTNPLRTNGTGANTLALEVQTSQALAAADATKIGLSNFSSTDFAVTATGFVTLSTTGAAKTITGDSGGALSPTANNWNILGSGSITTVGAVSTLTVQLTGLTNHAVLVGAGTATITKVGPTATAGQVLQSAGAAADPAFSTATYPSTTTINQVLYSSSANVVGGITAANNGTMISGATGIPSFLANGTTAQVLTATTGSPPSWANSSSLRSFQIFSSGTAATYTKPAGITSILVECLGGGGGGGGVSTALGQISAAQGGGAGGYSRKFYSSPSATYTYTVGTGGSGGTAGANTGSTGNNTTFDVITANGGVGGSGDATSATVHLGAGVGGEGVGGGASGGDINFVGISGYVGVTTLTNCSGGFGGASFYGAGGSQTFVAGSTSSAGNGGAFGSGGAGAASNNTTTNRAGGNGGAGIIIVWEFG